MTPFEIKLLHGEASFLHHLDGIIDKHPIGVTLVLLYLFMLVMVLVIVDVARRHAKGLIKPGPRIIYIESTTPPPPPEPTFDPFPPRPHCDCNDD